MKNTLSDVFCNRALRPPPLARRRGQQCPSLDPLDKPPQRLRISVQIPSELSPVNARSSRSLRSARSMSSIVDCLIRSFHTVYLIKQQVYYTNQLLAHA